MSDQKRQERIKANKERRKLKRERLVQEKAAMFEQREREHRELLAKGGPRTYVGRCRGFSFSFTFSGIPIPVNPDQISEDSNFKALEAETLMVMAQAEKDKGDQTKVN